MNLKSLKSIKSAQPSFPLNFSVDTEDNGDLSPVIYIENYENAHDLVLKILNEGENELYITANPSPPSITNFHFQLKFRPGTLSDDVIKKPLEVDISGSGDVTWKYMLEKDPISKIVYISITAESIPGDGKFILQPNEVLQIVIKRVTADPVGGARNTNVEFLYKDILNSVDPDNKLNGNRMQHMGIVNHQGLKSIPLLVETMGSGTILNTGVSNNITVQISNYSKNNMPFSNDPNDLTTFEVIIDAPTGDESGELFLTNKDGLNSIELAWREAEHWTIHPPEMVGYEKTWTIVNNGYQTLVSGESLIFDLREIYTELPEGTAKLQINYFNVPGYMDGSLHLDIVKSPIYFKDKKVGVWTNDPKCLLDVRGTEGVNILTITDSKGVAYTDNWIGMADNVGDNMKYLHIGGIKSGEGPEEKRRMVLVADIVKFLGALIDIRAHVNIQDSGSNAVFYGPQSDKGGYYFRKGDEGGYNELMTISNSGEVSAKAFIDDKGNIMPKGAIILWSGTWDENKLPGWALCDGTKGTPDLRGRFVIGAGGNYSVGTVGGVENVKLTIDQIPAHAHRYSYSNPLGSEGDGFYSGGHWSPAGVTTDTQVAGGGGDHTNMPPYYALCYIMKL